MEFPLGFYMFGKPFHLRLYKRLDSHSCHQEALAGDSKCRFLNVLSLVQSLSWIEVRRSGDPGSFQSKTLWFKNYPLVMALGP